MGQGYEDHLITPEDAIPNVDKVLLITYLVIKIFSLLLLLPLLYLLLP